jgi:hypothetical protein
MNLHAYCIQALVSIERPPKLHIGYFEMTLHMGIAFKVGSTPQVTKITYGIYQNELEYGYCI